MAKAREPRDLAGEGVQQGGVRGQEGLQESGLQVGGLEGLQVGAGRRGVEPALDNHLTGTLGGGERLSHIWDNTFHL